jgi:hypothetical protein
MFRFWMSKNDIFHHIIRSLEVSDDDTVEFVKAIEWSMNSTDSVPSLCNERLHLVYKTKKNLLVPAVRAK